MRLYVCHTTKGSNIHPCAKAYRALIASGYSPKINIVRGTGRLPRWFDPITKTSGRLVVEQLTGAIKVPALELDDGNVVVGCQNIVVWAKKNKL